VLPAPDHATAVLGARDVLAAVRALPDPYRDVVLAVDVAGYSYADGAELLDIPVGTVMSRLYRGRQRVIRTIEGDRPGSEARQGPWQPEVAEDGGVGETR
jgi:DNA-directed RNA polymerase specialized sigma24 family protein